MMKLRHLFNNPALAEMLLKNWDYDPASVELFEYFRISANAIYPFRQNGAICFLRCCPASEKSKDNLVAELDFICYLREQGYPALEPLPSKSGELLVQKMTPWGEQYASAFKRVAGKALDETDYADEVIYAYGAALGQLHQLSSIYSPGQSKRWSHAQVLDWIEATLRDLGEQGLALEECQLLRHSFARLPVQAANYGLIHYDFEPDNVFYDQASRTINVIDFDDAMGHWYVMDIVQALHCLKSQIPTPVHEAKQATFIQAYRRHFALDEELFAAAPLFRRFANLYSYTRNLRSTQEQWEHEPDWMVGLRRKLVASANEEAVYFGKPVSLPFSSAGIHER